MKKKRCATCGRKIKKHKLKVVQIDTESSGLPEVGYLLAKESERPNIPTPKGPLAQ